MDNKQHAISSEEVSKGFVVVLTGADEERTFRYVHPDTNRQFQAFRNKDLFFLVEVTPSNRIAEFNKQGYCISSKEDPRLSAIEASSGPNYFIEECHRLGINPEGLIFDVPSYSKDSVFHDSLDGCASEIARAITANVRYVSRTFAPLSEADVAEQQRLETRSKKQFWDFARQAAIAAKEHSAGIFNGCHNMGGGPLSKETKDRILSYLNNPSNDLWNDVRGAVVVGGTTLWQAWVAYDVQASRSGNKGFPSADALRESIRHAVDANMQRVESELRDLDLPTEPTPKPKLRLV